MYVFSTILTIRKKIRQRSGKDDGLRRRSTAASKGSRPATAAFSGLFRILHKQKNGGCRKYKSFDPTFSIGEIEDFSLEFRYAELPTVEQGLSGVS